MTSQGNSKDINDLSELLLDISALWSPRLRSRALAILNYSEVEFLLYIYK